MVNEGAFPAQAVPIVVGRYTLHAVIGRGGMATVHFGRLEGEGGFARTVAIKRLHPHLVHETDFVNAFLDEARLAARIHHPNVVSTLDVVREGPEIFVVLEYVRGEALSMLWRRTVSEGGRVPPRVAAAIASHVLRGLHAAHETRDGDGHPLAIVHRDVSPQNILVGTDGMARIIDFGVAKAATRLQTTTSGAVKGKVAYMPPEQLAGMATRPTTDVFALAAVLWECLTGRRLFAGDTEAATIARVLKGDIAPPSSIVDDPEVRMLDEVVMRGLAREEVRRYASAKDMADAIEELAPVAPAADVARWVEDVARDFLDERDGIIAAIESSRRPVLRRSDVVPRLAPDEERTIESGTRSRELEQMPADGERVVSSRRIEKRIEEVQETTDEHGRKAVRRKVTVITTVIVTTVAVVAAIAFVVLGDRGKRSIPTFAAGTGAATDAPSLSTAPSAPPPVASELVTVPPRYEAPPTRDCDVPYAVGPDGTKTYRTECMPRAAPPRRSAPVSRPVPARQ